MMAAFLIGRVIVGAFFIINGLNHFISHPMFTQFAAAKGVPLADIAVLVAGSLIVFGGTSLLLGWRPDLGIGAIVLFLIVVSFFMHDFWTQSGTAQMAEIANFTKNIALAGASLMLTAVPRPWPYSIEAPRRIAV